MADMVVHFHLVVTQGGSVKAVKNTPIARWDEISMAVRLEIPKQVFQRPQYTARLVIPETAIKSTDIPVDFTDQLQQIIQQTTGYEVKLSFVPAEREGGAHE